jgi:hypothetical protein
MASYGNMYPGNMYPGNGGYSDPGYSASVTNSRSNRGLKPSIDSLRDKIKAVATQDHNGQHKDHMKFDRHDQTLTNLVNDNGRLHTEIRALKMHIYQMQSQLNTLMNGKLNPMPNASIPPLNPFTTPFNPPAPAGMFRTAPR